jgi:hypothetical protein
VLVRADDGGIDEQILEVGIFGQSFEKAVPDTSHGPSSEALELAVPVAELGREITPWRTRSGNPEHSIDEQTIVRAVPPFVALFARNKPLDARPLRVFEFPPNQDRPPSVAILNHIREPGGIP